MMTHHHTMFGYKRLNSSEDIIWLKKVFRSNEQQFKNINSHTAITGVLTVTLTLMIAAHFLLAIAVKVNGDTYDYASPYQVWL